MLMIQSFPGGKVDPVSDLISFCYEKWNADMSKTIQADTSLVHAALREAQEELALPSENVEILGTFDSEYSFGNRARVWPFVVRLLALNHPLIADQTPGVHPLYSPSQVLNDTH